MPLRLFFRKAVLWHDGKQHVLRDFRERKRDHKDLQWDFRCSSGDGLQVDATFDGRGASMHRLPYVKTDYTGSFEVANNSLAIATVCLRRGNGAIEKLETTTGAVLEMVGS